MNTMFLATVVGWYMVIFGLLMLSRQELIRSIFSDIMTQKSLFFMLAFITFLIGLLLVASHNIWIMDWPVSLTVFGWCILGGALIRLFFLEFMLKAGRSFLSNRMNMIIMGLFFLGFGLYLLLHVYYFPA